MSRRSNLLMVFLLVGVAILAIVSSAGARRDGVSGRAQGGCTCHGSGSPWLGIGGQYPIVPSVEGFPDAYEPGVTYALDVSVSGGFPYLKAGFDLNVTAGQLSIPPEEPNAQITTPASFGGVAGEATHKTPDSRAWKVLWTAPPPGSGPVTVSLAVNSVNGNDLPDAADQWNKLQSLVAEKNLPPRPATGLAATDHAGNVSFVWVPSPDADVTEVVLHGSKDAGFEPSDATVLARANTTANATVLHLRPGGYEFLLRVTDKGGLRADSERVAFTVNAPPSNSTAQPSQTETTASTHETPGFGPVWLLAALAPATLLRRRGQHGGRMQ